jgi:hypothetical protein
MRALYEAMGWLAILPSLAGVVVSAVCLRTSWWSGVLLSGFLLQTALSASYRVASMFMSGGIPESSGGVWIWFVATSVLALLANAAIVCGVAGLLREVGRGRRERPALLAPPARDANPV